MKKFLTFILVLTAVLSVSSIALATDINVSDQPGLSAALSTAATGDNIIIAEGTYSGPINPTNEGVTITGVGNVTFTGPTKITGTNVTIDNVTFSNPSGNALYNTSFSGTIKNSKITGSNGFRECKILPGGKVTIESCEITGNTYGIHFDGNAGCLGIEIIGCTITGWNSFATTIPHVTISNTEFIKGNYGQLRFYQDATVTDCTFDPEMNIDVGNDGERTFTDCKTSDGSDLEDLFDVEESAGFIVDGGLLVDDQATLAAALADHTVTSIKLAKDITITGDWDCRAAKITASGLVIDGSGHTIKITGRINDGNNHHAFLRAEAPATVKKLTIDMSEATSLNETRMRAISTNANLTVDGCTFIGNPAYTNTRAIIFGEGAGTNVGNLEIKITNSTFKDWRYGIRDNENGQDVKSVEISGNEFDNAGVNVCAKESITFTNNMLGNSAALLHSYTNRVAGSTEKGKPDSLTVTGNTLDGKTANTVDENGNLVEDPAPSQSPEINPTTSSGNGISVKYNGGNSFSTSNPSVPTGVEIDGVPVTFNGTGSNFTVGCISSDAKWVTVRWNSTSVTTNFTPDGLVECTTVSIPKTGDMSFWAAVAAFFGF